MCRSEVEERAGLDVGTESAGTTIAAFVPLESPVLERAAPARGIVAVF